MRVLVLGATGFIGGEIARQALHQGWHVRGLRRRPQAVGHVEEAPIQWVDGNLDRPESMRRAFEGVQVVFHAAGYYPQRGGAVAAHVSYAVERMRRVLDAAQEAGVQRMIYTSSMTTILRKPQENGGLANEKHHYIPGNLPRCAYYECKYAMESEVMRRAAQGFPVVIMNPTAVFGPGDVHMMTGSILLAIARGWGLGWVDAVLNVVDVRDVAKAQVRAVDAGKPGERYLLAGHNLSIRQFITRVAALAGKPAPKVRFPLSLIDAAIRVEDLFPGQVSLSNHLRAIRCWNGYDNHKARRALDLQPRPFNETVLDSLDWACSKGLL